MEFLEPLAAIPALFIGCCVVLGLLVGSFLNVVIYRVPVMMDNALRAECATLADQSANAAPPPAFNLIVPRSACPNCKAPITALQNIPVVSWLALGRKCANCKTPISARYPLVELAHRRALGLRRLALRLRHRWRSPALLFTWFLIALTMIDFDTQFLPDQLTYPLLWLGLLAEPIASGLGGRRGAVTPADSIVGAVPAT